MIETVVERSVADGHESVLINKPQVGLSGECYFSDAIFTQELRSLWCNTWQMVGRESDVPHPGDYLTCTVGNQPLFIIRANTGKLLALHNVCPHRSARLLEGQGHCDQRIRCPYHAWRFDWQGNLLGLPQAQSFPGLDNAKVHLLNAQVDTWGGFIFVNLATESESLKHYLAGFPAYLEQYEQDWAALQKVDHWVYQEPVNWKFPIENYLECYHLPIVHGKSLPCFNPADIHQTRTGRHFQIFVPFSKQASVHEASVFAGDPHSWSYQGFIFPNWMVNTAKDKVSVFRVMPLTPTTTQFEVLIYQTPAQMAAFPYHAEDCRPEFDRLLREDFTVVRSLQSNVHSIAYGVLQLAEIELGIAHFHQAWSEYML